MIVPGGWGKGAGRRCDVFLPSVQVQEAVDVHTENVGKMERNVERLRHHKEEKDKWSRKKTSGEGERVGSKGTTSCVPRLPIMERIAFLCHCHQMRNHHPSVWDIQGSTCSIKFTNKVTGERYGVTQ